jgi:hypothetical protein
MRPTSSASATRRVVIVDCFAPSLSLDERGARGGRRRGHRLRRGRIPEPDALRPSGPAMGAPPAWAARPPLACARDDDTAPGARARRGGPFRWMHVEKLEAHDGVPAYARAQGED